MLLFEHPYVLDRRQFDALREVVEPEGIDEFEVLTIERRTPQRHHAFDFSQWEEYQSTVFGEENLLYSPKGNWGMLLTAFGHVAVGGSAGFADRLRLGLIRRGMLSSTDHPPESQDVLAFLCEAKGWLPEGVTGWPEGLLRHLYGEPQASDFFERHRRDSESSR
jgi:hypothetical protein